METGKKRKRHTAVEKDVSTKLTGKLHHGLKEVRKAAKKAKSFEAQRLVKRIKDLRKTIRNPEVDSEDLKDLEIQLKSLKRTDHEHIAHVALSSKVRKDKKLSSNDLLISAFTSIPSSNLKPETQNAKVESRLLSSKFLAAEVGSVISSLRMVLDHDTKSMTGDKLKIREAGQTEEGMEDLRDDKLDADLCMSSDNDDGTRVGDTGEAPVLDGMMDEANDLVAEDSWESGSVHGNEQSDSDDAFTQFNRAPPDENDPVSGSRFLPSLSVGYIRGDSDSDSDHSENETIENGRKNRRGQRARQAIWEKKYGKNAKHVRKQREDARAAATARTLGKRPDKGWTGRGQGDSSPSKHIPGAASARPPKFSQDKSQRNPHLEKPTHPSWEAKKRLKEKEGARILPSQGKKIVFA